MDKVKPKRHVQHVYDMLDGLSDGAYFVMVVEDESLRGPFASPPRGTAFMMGDRWVVFSPLEAAN
jgi:hypothetical protein